MRELVLYCREEQAEAWSDALLEAGVLSVSVEDAERDTDAEQALFGEPGTEPEVQAWRNNRVVALLPDDLEPGEAVEVALDIDPRLMAEWENDAWVVEAGVYEFALGNDAGDLLSPVPVNVRGFEIAPDGKTIR